MLSVLNYVDGRFVGSRDSFPDIDPVDGAAHAEVFGADRELLDAAVESARDARRGGMLRVRPEMHHDSGSLTVRIAPVPNRRYINAPSRIIDLVDHPVVADA